MSAIYDPKTFNPKTAIGGLVGRVKLKLHEALDAGTCAAMTSRPRST